MRETAKEIRVQIGQCLEDAKDAIAQYELALITMAEHVLWLIGLDLIISAKWHDGGFVISADAPSGDNDYIPGRTELLEQILAEFLHKNDPTGELVFRFESNVVVSKGEADRIRKRLKIHTPKARKTKHENRKQARK